MTLQEVFKKQLENSKEITKEVLENMEFKRTSLNNLFEVGDKLIVAWVLIDTDNMDERKLMHFKDSEIPLFFKNKLFLDFDTFDGLPIFKIKKSDI